MQDLLFGVETEYALSGITLRGNAASPAALAGHLIALAGDELPHLGRRDTDLFLENGSRLYLDCGSHPEFATPECLDPWEIVRYVRAGERILVQLAERTRDLCMPGGTLMVLRSNVDYSGLTTWGCHESYLSRTAITEVRDLELVPHLVSRIIYTGAGGFCPADPGIRFRLSPRADYIKAVRSRESTSQRGILHVRHESLAGDYERVHIIFGESLCSDRALWLKVGTTALLTAMIDAGLSPASRVHLASPLAALAIWNADVTCRAKAALADGRMLSALEVQRHLLDQVVAHRRAWFMPEWVDEVCSEWARVLDMLERGPETVASTLDWAIKRVLFMAYADRSNIPWDTVTSLNALPSDHPTVLQKLRDAEFAELRRRLFEIDLRFGQLGPHGIFNALDAAGTVTHRISDAAAERRADASTTPPILGRARIRGNAIRRLAGERERYSCDWDYIIDEHLHRRIDLSDPFERVERWVPV